MWEMLDNIFTAVGRGGRVVDLEMEKIEVKAVVEVQAIKSVLTEPETLEAILTKTRKDFGKDYGVRSDEFDPFIALRVAKEGK